MSFAVSPVLKNKSWRNRAGGARHVVAPQTGRSAPKPQKSNHWQCAAADASANQAQRN
ncbi:MAG TPA: hypothetical protein VN715_16625 [Roseiarcus sp.]|nr:hypothetical protein [Roseiarcus sp.]